MLEVVVAWDHPTIIVDGVTKNSGAATVRQEACRIDRFMVPLETMVKSRFITITARAAGVTWSSGAPSHCCRRNLWRHRESHRQLRVRGSFGVRVVCVRTLANTDRRSIQDTMAFPAGQFNITKDQAMA